MIKKRDKDKTKFVKNNKKENPFQNENKDKKSRNRVN